MRYHSQAPLQDRSALFCVESQQKTGFTLTKTMAWLKYVSGSSLAMVTTCTDFLNLNSWLTSAWPDFIDVFFWSLLPGFVFKRIFLANTRAAFVSQPSWMLQPSPASWCDKCFGMNHCTSRSQRSDTSQPCHHAWPNTMRLASCGQISRERHAAARLGWAG